jgi:hypothetical protein
VDVDQERRALALRAVHLIEDIAVLAIREDAAAAIDHVLEQVVAQLVLGRERRPVETRAQVGERGDVEIAAGERGLVGELAPAAIILVLDAAIGLASGERSSCA